MNFTRDAMFPIACVLHLQDFMNPVSQRELQTIDDRIVLPRINARAYPTPAFNLVEKQPRALLQEQFVVVSPDSRVLANRD